MAERYYLSERDRDFLRKVVEDYLQRREEKSLRRSPEDMIHQAPECYVVRVPTGGIAAFVTETGTGSDIGGDTGTGLDTAYMPSYADCPVYRGDIVAPRNILELVAVGRSLRVYNLSEQEICEHTFVIVMRDKYGRWYVPNPGWCFEQC